VVLALIAATAVAGIGIAVHSRGDDGQDRAQRVSIIKAGKPAMVASRGEVAVR